MKKGYRLIQSLPDGTIIDEWLCADNEALKGVAKAVCISFTDNEDRLIKSEWSEVELTDAEYADTIGYLRTLSRELLEQELYVQYGYQTPDRKSRNFKAE